MLEYHSVLILFFILLFTNCKNESTSTNSFGDLNYDELPARWDEGLPLGNGKLGVLIWRQGDQLRFSLDRADLWDLRELPELKQMTFDWVQQQVERGKYDTVQQLGDAPYDEKPYPTKIQAAGLNFNIEQLGAVEKVCLFIKPAQAQFSWSSGASLTTFVHADKPVGWFRFKHVPESFNPILDIPAYGSDQTISGEAGQQQHHRLADLGYRQGEVVRTDTSIIYTQPSWDGMHYQVAVRWKNESGICTGAWSITSQYFNQPVSQIIGDKDKDEAAKITVEALEWGFERDQSSHQDWWNQYWTRSQVQVPDTLLQQQYEREMYKFGAATRPDAPPITLQAVWTADNGSIPPWKGDFHHDLNTQLSYWPGYTGNYLELTRSFTKWLWNIRSQNKEYTRWYFQSDGLNVPGVTTLTGQPMGGWIQYSMSPTISAWLAQHFYWQWTYSQDERFLRERAYPYLHEVAVFLEDVSYMKNGKRTLPLSSSPEIHDNRIEAWFNELTNYDLALMKKAFGMAVELAAELGKKDHQQRWEQRKAELPDFATNKQAGLLVAPSEPLGSSHRHFSHLMAIHPLGLLDPSYGEEDQQLIETSLKIILNKLAQRGGPDILLAG